MLAADATAIGPAHSFEGSRRGPAAPKPAVEMPTPHAELRHELEHLKLATSVLGYDRKAVDMLLEQLGARWAELSGRLAELEGVREELRAMSLERDELRLRVAELESGRLTSSELAELVRNGIAAAEREASQIRAHARREASALLAPGRRDPTRAPDGGRTGVRPLELDARPARRAQPDAPPARPAESAGLEARCSRLTEELERLRAEIRSSPEHVETLG